MTKAGGRVLPAVVLLASLFASGAAARCGGDFPDFLAGLESDAVARGYTPEEAAAFLAEARLDERVLRADRAQSIFLKSFIDFSRAVISQSRLDKGRANADRYSAVFDRAEAENGVPRGVLLAFWALETDYGAVQGDFNTLDALVTLAHDCRRPELFRPQIFAAMELWRNGDFDPATTTGAWAGEIGMVQMLPGDILAHGRDGDGDEHVRLKDSPADALLSAADKMQSLGWRAGEPWLVEVTVPETLDWAATGLDHPRPVAEWETAGLRAREGALPPGDSAALVLPMGRKGPAFLAYPNFRVFFEWNQSFVYVTTAAYFATRLEGAPRYDPGEPDPGLSPDEMTKLQELLAARGHDVGQVDGILGEKTRRAVQAEQARLGLPADAWPTRALLDALG